MDIEIIKIDKKELLNILSNNSFNYKITKKGKKVISNSYIEIENLINKNLNKDKFYIEYVDNKIKLHTIDKDFTFTFLLEKVDFINKIKKEKIGIPKFL